MGEQKNPEFTRQMKLAERIMQEDSITLKGLARGNVDQALRESMADYSDLYKKLSD